MTEDDKITVNEHTRRKPVRRPKDIESIAPQAGDKITDAEKVKAAAISDPQKRATNVTIIGAVDPTRKGVEVVTQHPAK